jgi:hypothetical protein
MSLGRILGAASAVIGAGFLFLLITWQTDVVPAVGLVPRAFPTIAAVLIIVTGLAQLVKPTGTAIFEGDKILKAVYVVTACLTATFALEFVGYMYTAPVLVGAIMLLSGERRWLWYIVGLVVLPALIWFVFEIVLRRPLP